MPVALLLRAQATPAQPIAGQAVLIQWRGVDGAEEPVTISLPSLTATRPDGSVVDLDGIEREYDDGSPEPAVLSVLPVALRRALRATPSPSGEGHALAYVLAALSSPGYEEPRDAFEYMVRALRADLLELGFALGFGVAQIDAVLALAATYPGSDAVMGPVE